MNRIISILPSKVSVIINASAIGYYGISDDGTFTETSESIGDDFLELALFNYGKGKRLNHALIVKGWSLQDSG